MAVPLVSMAQQQYPIDNVTDGMLKGAKVGEMTRESELLREQRELMRRQREILERNHEREKAQSSFDRLVVITWKQLLQRYPDLDLYRREIIRLSGGFTRGDVSMEDYLEGLYHLAKYAPFSRSPAAVNPKSNNPPQTAEDQ